MFASQNMFHSFVWTFQDLYYLVDISIESEDWLEMPGFYSGKSTMITLSIETEVPKQTK